MLGESKENQIIFEYLQSLGYTSDTVDEKCAFGDVFDRVKCRNIIFTPK
jgi:hypothetical protein